MDRTASTRTPLAPVAALLSALALLVALTGPGLAPAGADQFTPLEDPPTIDVASTGIAVGDPTVGQDFSPGDLSSFTSFTPASPRSDDIYNVFATIETNGQLSNVEAIRFCLYDSAVHTTSVDDVCGIPADQASGDELPTLPGAIETDNRPEDRLVMEWRTDAYHDEVLDEDDGDTDPDVVIVGDNNYEDNGTEYEGVSTDTNGSAVARFSFKVSEAMGVSAAWRVRVAVQAQATIGGFEQDAQSAIDDDSAVDHSVDYFSTMATSNRSTVDYGVVVPGVTAVEENITSGTYHANDASVLTISADDFTGSSETISLDDKGDVGDTSATRYTGESGRVARIKNVTDGAVSLDCAAVTSFTDPVDGLPADTGDLSALVQVGTSARVLATGLTATDESEDTVDAHTCMLSYPGGGTEANVAYSNTVTLAAVQDSSFSVGEDPS